MDPTKALYNEVCDTIDGRTDAAGLFDIGYSLTLLGLSKMEPAEREMQLTVLGPNICHGLDRLEELRQLKQLNKRLNGKSGLGI